MIVQFVILLFVLCSEGFLGENSGMLGFALQVTGTPLPHLTGNFFFIKPVIHSISYSEFELTRQGNHDKRSSVNI